MTSESASGFPLRPPRWFVQWHLAIGAILVLFSVFSLAGLFRLGFDDDLESLFRGETQEYRDFRKYNQLFDSQDNRCLILLTASDVLSVESLKCLRNLDTGLHSIEGLAEIHSLCHLLSAKRVGRIFLPVLPFPGASDLAWSRASEELRHHPLGLGLIYSDDHRHALITFRFEQELAESARQSALEKIEEAIATHWLARDASESGAKDGNREAGLTGIPILRGEVTSHLQRDQQKFTWLGLVFALLIGWCLFRKPVPVLFVAGVPFLGLGCIMGLLGWLGVSLNIVNNVITPLVLVIGFAEVIHILFVTGGLMGEGQSRHDAVINMIRQLFLPSLLAALTTAIGFASLFLSTDRSLREFAVIASLASLIMFWIVLAASSCLLATPLARYCLRTVPVSARNRGPGTRQARIGSLPLAILTVLSVLLVAVSATISTRNHTDFRFTENLPEFNSAVLTLRKIDAAFGGSSADQLIVCFEPKPTPQQLISTLDLICRRVNAIDNLGQTTSFLDLLDSLPPAGGSDLSHFAQLQWLPKEAWDDFLTVRPTIARIVLKMPDLGSARLEPVIARIRHELAELESELKGFSATVTGLNILSVRRSQQMIGDLSASLMGASLAIFLLVTVCYRSLLFSLAAIIVNAIPILGVAAIMCLVGQPVQYTGIMLLCVCLGLAVDDTVHFLSKLQIQIRQGTEFEEAVMETIRKLWPVFLTTTLMLGVGFGLAATSEIPTFQTFGGFACVALVLALLADLVLLPAILILLHRIFSRPV